MFSVTPWWGGLTRSVMCLKGWLHGSNDQIDGSGKKGRLLVCSVLKWFLKITNNSGCVCRQLGALFALASGPSWL